LDRPIRVLLADDHAVVRRGLRLFLDLQDGIEVVGEAADGAEAAEVAGAAGPDVIVMDLSMPGLDGIEATRLVRAEHGAAKVLVLSSFVDERVLPALRAGAEGYLTKDSEPAELAAAIRSVHAGDPVFCPDALRRLTRELFGGRLRPEGTVTIAFTDVEARPRSWRTSASGTRASFCASTTASSAPRSRNTEERRSSGMAMRSCSRSRARGRRCSARRRSSAPWTTSRCACESG